MPQLLTKPISPARSHSRIQTPRILFVATREPAYSRVTVVLSCLRDQFDVDVVDCKSSGYPLRILAVMGRFLMLAVTGRLTRYDAVFVGFMAQPILPFVRIFWRGPLFADGYFSMYDTLAFDKRLVSPRSILARIAYRLDRFMLRTAKVVFTDTAAHCQYFHANFETPGARLRRLWISANEESFRPLPDKRYSPQDEFHVLFWGGFIPLQGVETIVEAAAMLRDERIRFTVFGSGQTYDAAVRRIHEVGATNVELRGWANASELRRAAQEAHLALGIFGVTEKAARVIPNKVFEAMAMGLPVVTGDSPAIRELLTDGVDAVLVERGNPSALAQAIREARSDYSRTVQIGQRGLETFRSRAAPACISRDMCETIATVLQEQAP